MHFGFALDLSDIDLWNIDLLDTHSDLLDTDMPSKHFVCLYNVFKTSSRHVFKKSWRQIQRNNFSSSKTSSRRLPRCLQDVLEDEKLLRWRRVEDVLETCLAWRRLQYQQMFAGIVVRNSVAEPSDALENQWFSV